MKGDDRIVYVRTWCMGKCGRYSTRSSVPKVCPKCGGEVLCVPITVGTLRREGKPS